MKVDRTELVYKLVEAINDCAKKEDPAQDIIDMGNALSKVGRVLKGIPLDKARAIVLTVKHMNDSGLMDIKEDAPSDIKNSGFEEIKRHSF